MPDPESSRCRVDPKANSNKWCSEEPVRTPARHVRHLWRSGQVASLDELAIQMTEELARSPVRARSVQRAGHVVRDEVVLTEESVRLTGDPARFVQRVDVLRGEAIPTEEELQGRQRATTEIHYPAVKQEAPSQEPSWVDASLELPLDMRFKARALEVRHERVRPPSMPQSAKLLAALPGPSSDNRDECLNDIPRAILESRGPEAPKVDFQYDLCNTYLQCGRFEEFCNDWEIHGEDRIELDKGRLTAALFPQDFCHHLETLVLSNDGSRLSQLFKEATALVVKDLPYATKTVQEGGNQPFQFFDETWCGDPVNVDIVSSLGGLVAICQKLLPGEDIDLEGQETNSPTEYCIVQHNLTGAYVCRTVEREDFNKDQLLEDAIGILGFGTVDNGIYVENVRGDGSYYSGNLKDFSYKFAHNENGDVEATDKQCARKLFGHLKGAEFLAAKEYGLKCSPLLAMALAVATNTMFLELEWNTTKGHIQGHNIISPMEIYDKWQILYTHKINEFGLVVEWGMEQVRAFEMGNSQAVGTSLPSLAHSQEMQALASQTPDMQACAQIFGNAVQQKRSIGFQVTFPGGVGVGGSFDKFGSKGKELADQAHSRIMKHLRRERCVETVAENLDAKHAHMKEYLLQGKLCDASHNYLVVGDDVGNGHVSIYWAREDGMLEWITDTLLPVGKTVDKTLKGLRMEVKRDGTKLVTTEQFKSKSDLMSRFLKHKKLDIDNSMVPVQVGQSLDQWVHLIGPQAKYSGNKYLWEATPMRAIISSRTSYSSGAILETDVLNDIGYCTRHETDAPLVHECVKVVAWGQFSQAPMSLVQGAKLIKWGGLELVENLC